MAVILLLFYVISFLNIAICQFVDPVVTIVPNPVHDGIEVRLMCSHSLRVEQINTVRWKKDGDYVYNYMNGSSGGPGGEWDGRNVSGVAQDYLHTLTMISQACDNGSYTCLTTNGTMSKESSNEIQSTLKSADNITIGIINGDWELTCSECPCLLTPEDEEKLKGATFTCLGQGMRPPDLEPISDPPGYLDTDIINSTYDYDSSSCIYNNVLIETKILDTVLEAKEKSEDISFSCGAFPSTATGSSQCDKLIFVNYKSNCPWWCILLSVLGVLAVSAPLIWCCICGCVWPSICCTDCCPCGGCCKERFPCPCCRKEEDIKKNKNDDSQAPV